MPIYVSYSACGTGSSAFESTYQAFLITPQGVMIFVYLFISYSAFKQQFSHSGALARFCPSEAGFIC